MTGFKVDGNGSRTEINQQMLHVLSGIMEGREASGKTSPPHPKCYSFEKSSCPNAQFKAKNSHFEKILKQN